MRLNRRSNVSNRSSNTKVSNDDLLFLEMLRIHWRDSTEKKNQMISMVQSLYLTVALVRAVFCLIHIYLGGNCAIGQVSCKYTKQLFGVFILICLSKQ